MLTLALKDQATDPSVALESAIETLKNITTERVVDVDLQLTKENYDKFITHPMIAGSGDLRVNIVENRARYKGVNILLGPEGQTEYLVANLHSCMPGNPIKIMYPVFTHGYVPPVGG
jgi:hypothetical protein